jgi:hypothetical protein
VEFGLYELSDYIFSYDMLQKIKNEKDDVIEALYDDCDPTITQTDYDLGVTRKVSVSVEDMAILIIEAKEGYALMEKRYEAKAQLFDEALATLTEREKDVVQVQYFQKENNLGLSLEYFRNTLRAAEKKLCAAICELNLKKKKEWKQIMKAERVKRVQEWKQAN